MLPGVHSKEWPVETYRRYHWADIVCAKANMAAYPSTIVESVELQMTKEQAASFDVIEMFARARAKTDYEPLRKSAP